jgi:hypothetical protein
VNIFQRGRALSGITNVCHHVVRQNWILLYEASYWRTAARFRIEKRAEAPTFINREAPSVRMNVGATTTPTKASKSESKVGWSCGVNS